MDDLHRWNQEHVHRPLYGASMFVLWPTLALVGSEKRRTTSGRARG